MSDYEPLFCYNHPDRETSLRCSRCERPICPKCAVLTPTGYRCKECLRTQQKIFETAKSYDYLIAFVIAAALAFVGSLVSSFMGFFTLFIAPIAGVIIAEAVRKATGRRRSRRLYQVVVAAVIIGSLPRMVIVLLPMLVYGVDFSTIYALLPLAYQVLYVFLAASSARYRLSGIQVSF